MQNLWIPIETLGDRVVRLRYRLVNRLFRIRRLQRYFGHLGQHLQDLVQTPEFRRRLLNSRLTRPGVAHAEPEGPEEQ
jgi:hypothetical protein